MSTVHSLPGAKIADAHLRMRRPSIEDGSRAMGWLAYEADGARDSLPIGTAVTFDVDPHDIAADLVSVILSPGDVSRTPSSTWVCHLCTLVNKASFLNCEAWYATFACSCVHAASAFHVRVVSQLHVATAA
jgi:hypothetical protein